MADCQDVYGLDANGVDSSQELGQFCGVAGRVVASSVAGVEELVGCLIWGAVDSVRCDTTRLQRRFGLSCDRLARGQERCRLDRSGST